MIIEAAQAHLQLQAGQFAHLQLQPRARVRGLAGHSWLTLDRDPRDIVLGPGEEFVADSPAHALVCALRAGAVAELLVQS